MNERPPFFVNWKDHVGADDNHYTGSDEPICYGAEFTALMGFKHLGLGVDIVKPGRRSSWPHCHEGEEEFVFILQGQADVWIDGEIFPASAGDCIGFPAGTGIAHTIINNGTEDVAYFVVGERDKMSNTRIHYPLHPKRNEEIGERHWQEAEGRALGPHDGKPDALREREKS